MPRRFLAPQVVQTSAMDCGPASLACLLGGFGIHASYGRLREACQTDVDGTSIDAMEDIANLLGLEAEQVMMPAEHVVLAEGGALPALVATRHPTGLTHFVVAWRLWRGWIQVMDPAVGRRWIRAERFRRDLYAHDFSVPEDAFAAWAATDGFLAPLRRRAAAVGAPASLVAEAAAQGWEALARLDGAVRMAAATGGPLPGPGDTVPDGYRFAIGRGDGDVAIKGAVLVRVLGPSGTPPDPAQLPPDLRAALEEPRPRPARIVLGLLSAAKGVPPAVLAVAAALAAMGTVGEALLLRGLVRAVRAGGSAGVAGILGLAVALLVLEGWLAAAALGLGRRVESDLRERLHDLLPRLPDRYFRSRPVSDLGERAHRLHLLRQLPPLGVELARAATEVAALTVGIAVVNPPSAVPAVLSALVAVGAALAIQPALVERDLRLRNHTGATARFYLDGLLGLVALQAHSAAPVVEAEHTRLLREWRAAARSVARTVVAAEALQGAVGVALTVWLVSSARGRAGDPATFLLIAYWAMSLPVLGQRIAVLARQYPTYRNTTLRFLEPLATAEEPGAGTPVPARPREAFANGADIRFDGVGVVAGGQEILAGVDLHLPAGSRVAVVGPSGAGKSSLVGVLLGWHRPAGGQVLVDGEALDQAGLARLRRHTAWVDPAVAVWNRSLAANLDYAARCPDRVASALAGAELGGVADRLPKGIDEDLGEGGGLLSGGEAQRVRLGRALAQDGVRLAVLDEPFRGLDRAQRRLLLERSRAWWPGATVLLVTHDVGDTLDFERVLVLEGGRVVEDGVPRALAAEDGSRYTALLRAEDEAAAAFADRRWRRLRMEGGTLQVAEPGE